MPIGASEHALVQFEYRTDKDAVQSTMEGRYRSDGEASDEEDVPPSGKYGAGNEYAPSPSNGNGPLNGAEASKPPDDFGLADVRPI